MKILHMHGGRDGGAERFFVRLVNALGRRGVEQQAIIRPDRVWRSEINPDFCQTFEDLHAYRRWITHVAWPTSMQYRAASFRPDVSMSWLPSITARFHPFYSRLKVCRLSTYYRPKHFRKVDLVIAIAPKSVDHVLGSGWDPSKCELIPNFVERRSKPAVVSRNELAQTDKDVSNAKLIVAVGRLDPMKGFDVLIRAFAQLEGDNYLTILGNGGHRRTLERLVQELDLGDRVSLPGWVTEPRDYVAAADLFVCPSRWEPLGNVVLEAFSEGAPIVASTAEGPGYMIEDGVSGMLTPVEEVEPLANAMREVLSNEALAARLAAGGVKRFEEHFSEDVICDRYISEFERRLSR